MKNLVNELDRLNQALDIELLLRRETQRELQQGIENGPMHLAHDQAIKSVILAAQTLLNQSNG